MDEEVFVYESEALKTKNFPNDVENGDVDDLEWNIRVEKEAGESGIEKITFIWTFNWQNLRRRRQIIGLRGTVETYLWNKERYAWNGPQEFNVEFSGDECTARKELKQNMTNCYSTDGAFWFKHGFELELICKKKTVLQVEGREIKVNRKILTKSSVYFEELFQNPDRTEFELDNVEYNDMKQLIGLFSPNPVMPRAISIPKLLELSDVFKLPSVPLVSEFLLLQTAEIPLEQKLELADKYKMNQLLQQCLNSLKTTEDVKSLVANTNFTEAVKLKLFDRMMSFSQ